VVRPRKTSVKSESASISSRRVRATPRRTDIPPKITMAEAKRFIEDGTKITALLHNESDRGAALTGSAFLERELGLLIRAFLVHEPSVVKTLLDGGMAPLKSFSARTRITFALGLISKAEYSDLSLVRAIRNEFAHEPFTATFDTETISARCKAFTLDKWASLGRRETARKSFLRVISLLGSRLGMRRHEVARQKMRPDEQFLEQFGAEVERATQTLISGLKSQDLLGKTREEISETALRPLKDCCPRSGGGENRCHSGTDR
jgi:DNA-binding MltR family transcriptional regulator